MSRTRLAGVFFLSVSLLPGCGLFTGDRPGICQRWSDRRADRCEATPVSFPVATTGGGECGGSIIPPGTPPIYNVPPYPGAGIGAETLPPNRIPKAGIDEGKGKQFELEGASRTGPVLTIPATGIRGN